MVLPQECATRVERSEKSVARSTFRETVFLRLWAWTKIPVLAFVRPSVVELDDRHCIVRIPLRRRTRNHLGSMYFAVLCAGADSAGGMIAMRRIQRDGNRVSLIFKDFHADFLRRAEGDVHFACSDGEAIAELLDEVVESGERGHLPVRVVATVPSISGDEPVAEFTLTLSLKLKSQS